LYQASWEQEKLHLLKHLPDVQVRNLLYLKMNMALQELMETG